MGTMRSGGGDAQRTLRLLWRASGREQPGHGRPARGRRPRVTVDQVVAAAVAVADRDELSAMSMERVARELGVGTMTLYTHVPGKAELLDLMLDAVLLELDLPGPGEPRPDGWRAQVELYAERTGALHRRHPWLGGVSMVRPPLGPGLLGRSEFLLSAFGGIGLTPAQAATAAEAVIAFVDAAASAQAQHDHVARATGESGDSWWAARDSLWTEHFDPARYPALTRTWQAGGLDRDAPQASAATFRRGLDWMLDGVAAALPR